MIWLVVDVVVGVLWIPVGVTHLVFLNKVLLRFPDVAVSMRVLNCREWSGIFRNVHLVLSHDVMQSAVLLVLEPSVRNTQIIIRMNSDGQLSWNGIPRIFVHFPNGGVSIHHLGHFIEGSRGPEDLNFFSLLVSDDLSAHISLISLVENINTKVHNKIGVINFFMGSKTELLDSKCFSSS